MKRILKSRKGLSTVVTTLIILVVSVLLATVVTFYAINIATTRMQSEDLKISMQHIWANSSMHQAAFVVTNVGGRDVLLDKITVRGQASNWTDVYYWKLTGSLTHDLNFSNVVNSTAPYPSSVTIPIESTPRPFTQAQASIAVTSGTTLIVYLRSPDSISVRDIGVTTGLTIHSANAMYPKDATVEYIPI